MKYKYRAIPIFFVSSLAAMEPANPPATLAGNDGLERLTDTLITDNFHETEENMSAAETVAAVTTGVALNAGALTIGSRLLTPQDRFVPVALSPEMLKIGIEGLGAVASAFLVYKMWGGVKALLWLPQEQRLKRLEHVTKELTQQNDAQQREAKKRFERVEASLVAVEAGVKATIAHVFSAIDNRHSELVTHHDQEYTRIQTLIEAFEAGQLKIEHLKDLQVHHETNSSELKKLLVVTEQEIEGLTPSKHKTVGQRITSLLKGAFHRSSKGSHPSDR